MPLSANKEIKRNSGLCYCFLFQNRNWKVWVIIHSQYPSNVRSHPQKKFHGDLECLQMSQTTFNPILTGGGGGVNLTPPPVRNQRLPRDRRRSQHAFSWVFSFKSYASFDTKFAKIGPSVARSHDVLFSHVGTKFAQNLHFAYVCVQNTWKLLIFFKCTKTVFILSFWPFAQFVISWN